MILGPSYDDTMVTHAEIEQALRGVLDPELGTDVVDLGMVRDIIIDGPSVTIRLALTIAECPMRNQIEGDVTRKLLALTGVEDVVVETTAMTKQQRSELMSTARFRARERAEPTRVPPTTRVVAIGSGKGGVGKSSTAVNLAFGIADLGYRVGLLDADIWGFSIPRMAGIDERLEASEHKLIQPARRDNLEVVSTGLIVESEETALMWRGLMLSKALEQFLNQVEWGPLDYLIVDLPPGTGDIQMSLARQLPQAEMIVVTTPQQAAQKVATRVADMARRSFMPIIGVVENMSAFVGRHGDRYAVFGSGGGQQLADDLGVPLLGEIPLDAAVAEGGDTGRPAVREDGPAAEAWQALVKRVLDAVPPSADETCTARIARLFEDVDAVRAGG